MSDPLQNRAWTLSRWIPKRKGERPEQCKPVTPYQNTCPFLRDAGSSPATYSLESLHGGSWLRPPRTEYAQLPHMTPSGGGSCSTSPCPGHSSLTQPFLEAEEESKEYIRRHPRPAPSKISRIWNRPLGRYGINLCKKPRDFWESMHPGPNTCSQRSEHFNTGWGQQCSSNSVRLSQVTIQLEHTKRMLAKSFAFKIFSTIKR